MIDFSGLFQKIENTDLDAWLPLIRQRLDDVYFNVKHGDLEAWESMLSSLPDKSHLKTRLDSSAIQVGELADLNDSERESLKQQLMVLHPWRKGPFNLFGLLIDTEWHSDWKWDRIKKSMSPLKGKTILDVGCGNGYHLWRMAAQDPELVIGVDPGLKYLYQFQVMQHYIQNSHVHMLPFGIEDVEQLKAFNTVFSMGVFYHRKSPIDHLYDLRGCLRNGGELVLETLVIDGKEGEVLVPEDRYAQMRNVWFLPSVLTLEAWVKRCGFKNVRTVDVNVTTTEEQRSTEWMTFHSLSNYLDPNDQAKTVEGYPAPKRAVVIAEAP